jgi:hypothetical protein
MDEIFHAWRRPAMTALMGRRWLGVRRRGELTLTIEDGHAPAQANLDFAFAGPTDVVALAGGAVAGRVPAPGTRDAEQTRFAHIEFGDPELPWRYTPVPNDPTTGLRPWLVLVVGRDDEIRLRGTLAHLRGVALTAHPLERSDRWAHVHEVGDGEI